LTKLVDLSILMVLLGLSCSLIFGPEPDGVVVEFDVILEGVWSLADTAAVYLVSNEQQWHDVLVLARDNESQSLPEIQIDFSKYMVLAAFMGEACTGGFWVEIASVIKKDKKLEVLVKIHQTSDPAPQVITSPFQIVRIPKGDYLLDVRYEEVYD
jgi:hypothetical protein